MPSTGVDGSDRVNICATLSLRRIGAFMPMHGSGLYPPLVAGIAFPVPFTPRVSAFGFPLRNADSIYDRGLRGGHFATSFQAL